MVIHLMNLFMLVNMYIYLIKNIKIKKKKKIYKIFGKKKKKKLFLVYSEFQ